jgi:hypothetical protein
MTTLLSWSLLLALTVSASAQDLIDAIEDTARIKTDGNQTMFAKLETGKYVQIFDDEWPDGSIESVSIFEADGITRSISVYPVCRSGNWTYGTENYYDKKGRFIGYVEIKNHFNAKCIEGSLHRTKMFIKRGGRFKLVKETITDEDGKDLSQAGCNDPYDFKPVIIKDARKYRKRIERD